MSRNKMFWFFLFIAAAVCTGTQLQGIVQDKETGLPLAAANIQIKDTYQGTISNAQGRFRLAVEHFPVLLKASFIGYHSEEILLVDLPKDEIIIELQPEPIMIGEMVITAQNPAISIMRKVITQKRIWQDSLRSFAADAYTRLRVDNDTAIVMISESTSRLFWDKEKGSREIVTSVQQTANFAQQMGPVGSSGIPNFYDDNIILAGYTFIGPTHKDALDYYNFELAGRLGVDGKLVYDITVTPKDSRQTAFSGSIYVQAESYAMVQVDLETGRAIPPAPFFPEMFFRCQQQFSNFGKEFWLPVDWRMSGAMKIAMTGLSFPRMKFEFYASLNRYEPNAAVPDSLYRETRDASPRRKAPSALLAEETRAIPLTFEESKAYQTIDTSMTFIKAFKPEGFLARFIKVDAKSDTVTVSASAGTPARAGVKFFRLQQYPEFAYNRVMGWRLGAGLGLVQKGESGLFVKGAYNTSLKRWDYGISGRWCLSARRKLELEATYDDAGRKFAGSAPYPDFMTGVASLLSFRDYHHYYWSKGWRAAVAMEPVRNFMSVEAAFLRSRHSSLQTTTDWRLFNRPYRANPAAEAGSLAEFSVLAQIGDLDETAGLAGRRALEILIEKSSPDWNSEFDYARAQGRLEWRFRTFYSRRLFPNTLDFILAGGQTWGDVPPQRLLSMNGSLGFYSPFGTFRTLRTTPAYGEKYLAFFAEHNFRSLPFELVGWNYMVEKGIQILVHGATGRSWLSERYENLPGQPLFSQRAGSEVGFSISGLATLARLDLSCRLSAEPAWFVSLGLGRLF
jgi:hypothetical protein